MARSTYIGTGRSRDRPSALLPWAWSSSRLAVLTGSYGTFVNPGVHLVHAAVLAVAGNVVRPVSLRLSGRLTFLSVGNVMSLLPSKALPDEVFARVRALAHKGNATTVTLAPVNVFSVVPVAQVKGRLYLGRSGGMPMALHFCPAVASREEVAGGPADGLFFSGGWNTVPGLGGHAPIGVHLSVGVDTGGFISSPFGISMSFATSCTYNVSFWALAGPVRLAGAVYGDGAGSAAGGVAFSSNFGVRVYAGATTVGVPPHLRFAPQVTFSSPGAQFNAAADVPVSAQYGTSVRFDVGGPTGVTVSVNNEVELTAQASAPHGTGCVLQAKLGAFSAHAKLLSRTIRSPRGSPMLNSTLWGPTSCEP